MSLTLVFFLASVIIIGAILFALICITNKKSRKTLNIEYYRVKYLEIENQLNKDHPSSYHLTILNADKLVGQALKEKGIKGATMAERMKNAALIFKDRNSVWTAHKLRNRIAHEPDVHIGYNDARYALACFKEALKDLGAI